MGKGRKARPITNRRTIGLLIGRLGDVGYASQIWPGVAAVAEERNVNLVCFAGGALNAPNAFDAQHNIAYDLISPARVDGLVSMSGAIGEFSKPEELELFYARYRPLPIVSIAMVLEGIPSISADNETGMRDSITHLIEVHKFRQIAFIRGPDTNPEANLRFKIYQIALAKHAIAFNPDLVVSGNFLGQSGAEAVRVLVDERKVHFEAIAAANDEMALGALAALQERGQRVPGDVSVVGFDDLFTNKAVMQQKCSWR
jgi:DNA-binding LacI/PurR family transcriptional regulator